MNFCAAHALAAYLLLMLSCDRGIPCTRLGRGDDAFLFIVLYFGHGLHVH